MFLIKDFPQPLINLFTTLTILDFFIVGFGLIYLEISIEILKNKGLRKMKKWSISYFNTKVYVDKFIYNDLAYFLIPFLNIKYLITSVYNIRKIKNEVTAQECYINQFIFDLKNGSFLKKYTNTHKIKNIVEDFVENNDNCDKILNIINIYYELEYSLQEVECYIDKDLKTRELLVNTRNEAVKDFLTFFDSEMKDYIQSMESKSLDKINSLKNTKRKMY